MPDHLETRTEASGRHEGKKHIIIVGAGIIGVCTAYYLVKHPKFDPEKYHISLVESKRVAGGASGKAGGLLALWAFPQQLVPLSFELHQQLADLYDGEESWDYRRLTTVSVEGDMSSVPDDIGGSGSQSPVGKEPAEKRPKKSTGATKSNESRKLPSALDWLAEDLVVACLSLGGKDTTAQVHPYKFTNFILKKAVDDARGALEVVLGKVNKILYLMDTGVANGVEYEASSVRATQTESARGPIRLLGDQIVLTVGPWTSKILPDCPISGLRAHLITIAPHNNETVSPFAIFTEYKVAGGSYVLPEIYARKDEVFVCGEGDSAVDVPETTDDVEVVKSKCDDLYKQVGKMSPALRKGHILRRQACYLPVLDVPSSSGPLIGETNVENLFLCSGHSCWGINNAPGSGKVMSELLLDGHATSANISSLDPSLYFDASVLVSDDEDE